MPFHCKSFIEIRQNAKKHFKFQIKFFTAIPYKGAYPSGCAVKSAVIHTAAGGQIIQATRGNAYGYG